MSPAAAARPRPFHGWGRWLAAGIVLVTLARLAVLALSPVPLGPDEAQYWVWSTELGFGYASKPPLIAWAIAAATGLCGDSAACIRAPSPVFYALAAWGAGLLGYRLGGAKAGLAAGLGLLLLPGVGFGAGQITTDAPLLACWAWALVAFDRLVRRGGRHWQDGLALGVAIGLGLNAKYAMVYSLLGLGLAAAFEPAVRRALVGRAGLVAAMAAAALIAPNLIWNALNGFQTLGHTVDNANLENGLQLDISEALEFLALQIAILGPVALLGLIALLRRRSLGPEARRLLWFSWPVLALMVLQAGLSRAHGNWAAVAHVGLIVVILASQGAAWRGWVLGANSVLAVLAGALMLTGGPTFGLPDPFKRQRGWDVAGLALATRAQEDGRVLVADERKIAALLSYHARAAGPVLMLGRDDGAGNHFERTRAYDRAKDGPALLVSPFAEASDRSRARLTLQRLAPLPAFAALARAPTLWRVD